MSSGFRLDVTYCPHALLNEAFVLFVRLPILLDVRIIAFLYVCAQ